MLQRNLELQQRTVRPIVSAAAIDQAG